MKVGNASVNGFDLAVAAGMLEGAMEHRFPVVLGKDFAGTVEVVGEGVTRLVVGQPVFGVVMKPYLGDGSFADYVTVPEQYGIERLPDSLDPTTAGAFGLVGSAALAAIDAASLSRLADDVLAGWLRVPIERTYQLSEVPTAFGDFTAGTLGKFAVTI